MYSCSSVMTKTTRCPSVPQASPKARPFFNRLAECPIPNCFVLGSLRNTCVRQRPIWRRESGLVPFAIEGSKIRVEAPFSKTPPLGYFRRGLAASLVGRRTATVRLRHWFRAMYSGDANVSIEFHSVSTRHIVYHATSNQRLRELGWRCVLYFLTRTTGSENKRTSPPSPVPSRPRRSSSS